MSAPASATSFLSTIQMQFLDSLPLAKDGDHGFPVCLIYNEQAYLIKRYPIASSALKYFVEHAPTGLYRGGAVIVPTYREKMLVVYDDRHRWFRFIGGIAHHDEGRNLERTGERELLEELFVFDLKHQHRFIPRNVTTLAPSLICSLGFQVHGIMPIGDLQLAYHFCNEANRAYEAVLTWDISEINEPFSVSMEEPLHKGNHSGMTVFLMDNKGAIKGVFAGEQGCIRLDTNIYHPTLRTFLARP